MSGRSMKLCLLIAIAFFGNSCQKSRLAVETRTGTGGSTIQTFGADGGVVSNGSSSVKIVAGTVSGATNAKVALTKVAVDGAQYPVDHLASGGTQIAFSQNDVVATSVSQPYVVTLAASSAFDPAKIMVLVLDSVSKKLISTITDLSLLTIGALADGRQTVSFSSQVPNAIFVLAVPSTSVTTPTPTPAVTAPTTALAGAPTGTNATTTLSVTVSGSGVVSYFYKVGNGISCSSSSGYNTTAIAVGQTISDNISGLGDGSVTLCVVGKNAAGIVQSYSAATSATWIKNSSAPNSISSLSISHSSGNAYLLWSAVSGSPTGYLVVRRAGAAVTWTPANGVTYTAGNSPDGGTSTIVYAGASTSYTDSTVSNGTTYYYSVYPYNALHSYQMSAPSRSTTPTAGGLWTWIFGPSTTGVAANYGTINVTAGTNTPGSRNGGQAWYVDDTHIYFYSGASGKSDLWRWDGSAWTWIYGSNATTAPNWGTVNVANVANTPGIRDQSCSVTDSAHNLWLFGGQDNAGNQFNDLWKFNGTNWIWIKGANATNPAGTYGSLGVSNPANNPGSRADAVCWIDAADHIWVYGGFSAGTAMGDLWMFDGTDWTWKSGANTGNSASVYGSLGVPNAANDPGSRGAASGVIDAAGNLWLFGGIMGFGSNQRNDMWKYDGANWTWMAGKNGFDQLDSTSGSIHPGARFASVMTLDRARNLIYIYGGRGCDSSSCVGGWSEHSLSDVWSYDIAGSSWSSVRTAPASSTGNYGSLNVTNPANFPAGRAYTPHWVDSHGDLWVFGSYWVNVTYYGDVWKFSP